MTWRIELEPGVRRELKGLSSENRRRVTEFLNDLGGDADPRELGSALQGRLKGLWRYRVGDYRILARIEFGRLVVLVVAVAHRSDVYR